MKRAFTFIEILVVLAILAVLAALLFPVFSKAKQQSKITESVLRQKQIYLAMMLYREDYGGDNGVFGEPSTMNLPYINTIPYEHHLYGLAPHLRYSPCGRHPNIRQTGGGIQHTWGDGSAWSLFVPIYRNNTYLSYDLNCNSFEFDALNRNRTKFGIAILLSGQLVKKWNIGEGRLPEFWADPEH